MPTVKHPKPAPATRFVKAPASPSATNKSVARRTVAKPTTSVNIETAESLTKDDIQDAVEIANSPLTESPAVETPKPISNGFSFKPIRRGRKFADELTEPKPVELPKEEAVIAPANPIPKPEQKSVPRVAPPKPSVSSPKRAANVINTPPAPEPTRTLPKPGTKIAPKPSPKPPINLTERNPSARPTRPQPAEDEEYVMTKDGINAMISTIVSELSERFVTKKEVDAVVRESLQTMMLNKIKK